MSIQNIVKAYMKSRAEIKRRRRIDARNKERIEALMSAGSPIKIELGAGANRGIPGWTYVDWNESCDLCLDLSNALPFEDGCIDEIYSCHLLEHFSYPELLSLLSECKRVLKDGGVFNASVPDARIYIEAYLAEKTLDPAHYLGYKPAYRATSKIDYINYIAYMDGHHKYMFDRENLVAILEKSGFRKVRLRSFEPKIDIESRNIQSICVLAEK